jgi:hypothetical protein
MADAEDLKSATGIRNRKEVKGLRVVGGHRSDAGSRQNVRVTFEPSPGVLGLAYEATVRGWMLRKAAA